MTTLSRRTELLLLALIVVVFAIVVGRAISYDFVWDDVQEIQLNSAFDAPLLDGLQTTQTERTAPDLTRLSTIELAYDSYRPLTFASLWLDVQMFGRSASALHRTNLLLGILAILAAYAVARRVLGGLGALVATAIFALHPVQIEAVAYISGRADLLAGLFVLVATSAGLHAVETERRSRGWIVLACFAFALSLCAKEAYVGFPLAFAALLWRKRLLRAAWRVPTGFAAIAIAFLVARTALVTSTKAGAIGDALVALPAVWGQYIRIVQLPFDLSTERLLDRTSIAITVVMVVVVIVMVARNRVILTRFRILLAGLACYAALIGPAAIPIASTGVVADRYAYAATLALAVAFVAMGRGVYDYWRHRWLASIPALWAAVCLFVAWHQVPVWRDNATLYTHAATMTPESSSAQYRLGFLDAQAERWPEAIARFQLAIARDPANVLALNNLGVAYLRTNEPVLAEAVLARATELSPAHFRAWLNLGLARLAIGQRERGCAAIARALEINPYYEAAQRQRCR